VGYHGNTFIFIKIVAKKFRLFLLIKILLRLIFGKKFNITIHPNLYHKMDFLYKIRKTSKLKDLVSIHQTIATNSLSYH